MCIRMSASTNPARLANGHNYEGTMKKVHLRKLAAIALRAGDGSAATQLVAEATDGIRGPDAQPWADWHDGEGDCPIPGLGALSLAEEISAGSSCDQRRSLTDQEALRLLAAWRKRERHPRA